MVVAGFLLTTSLWCQISSPEANHIESLQYPEFPGESNLFVFYQVNGEYHPGSLTAGLPLSGTYNFEWSVYDPSTHSFVPYFSETITETSTLEELSEGGYRVRIWNGTDTDTSFLAWVMLNRFSVETEKTDDNKVEPYKYTCDFLVLTGFVNIDSFYYYDPLSHDTILLENDYHFRWTSDNPDLFIPGDTIFLDYNYTESPPVIDTWYILTGYDDLGMTDVDSVLYESIHTKAEFTVEYYDKINDIYDSGLTESWSLETGSLDAPLTVRFINKSVNGDYFEWVYLDTLGGIKQNEFTYDLETQPEHTYMDADRYYYPYLVSIHRNELNFDECRDTFHIEEAIHIVPSQLSIPNVFSPNNDGTNDIFIFKHQSLKSCKLTIVDRFGKVVYRMQTDNIYSWEGWDGSIKGTDRKAPEGQYYFIIEALGYDGIEYRDPNILEKRKIKTDDDNNPGGSNQGEPKNNTSGLHTGWLYLFRGTGNY